MAASDTPWIHRSACPCGSRSRGNLPASPPPPPSTATPHVSSSPLPPSAASWPPPALVAPGLVAPCAGAPLLATAARRASALAAACDPDTDATATRTARSVSAPLSTALTLVGSPAARHPGAAALSPSPSSHCPSSPGSSWLAAAPRLATTPSASAAAVHRLRCVAPEAGPVSDTVDVSPEKLARSADAAAGGSRSGETAIPRRSRSMAEPPAPTSSAARRPAASGPA
mmetsp:Transcript_6508/g.26807  ORF Transcript_6508/g.26807 Transcript_6508/m.26807 type:complete len:228 (+) Transcript_6508:1279-1962(+)